MYTLPPLPYDYSALEPYIDKATMKLHHDKHHQAYVDNVNKALEGNEKLISKPVDWLISNLDQVPEDIRTKVRNNAGGHFNHSLFWTFLCPPSQNTEYKILNTKLGQELVKTFGSLEKLQEEFGTAALGIFGSGWCWLTSDLKIVTTPLQDNPIMQGAVPILGLDIWEHAYYLKYQNRRKDYIEAWWNVVNWEEVDKRLKDATS